MDYWAQRRLIKAIVLENAVGFLALTFGNYGVNMSKEDEKVLPEWNIEDCFLKEADALLMRLRKEAKQLRERDKQ